MAGSYKHCINSDNEFLDDIDGSSVLLDHMGDAREALEEMYDMIKYLSNGDKKKIYKAFIYGHLKKRYKRHKDIKFNEKDFNEYWRD